MITPTVSVSDRLLAHSRRIDKLNEKVLILEGIIILYTSAAILATLFIMLGR